MNHHATISGKRLVQILAALALLVVFIVLLASAWGSVGHRFINAKAVYHLPGEMLLFVQDSAAFGQHASDADNRKGSDPTEGPKHYIDLDNYPNYQSLPRSYDSVVALYGTTTVLQNGILPWATIWCYDSLVARLSRGDWNGALLSASDLGHYVGDGYQPLHITVNYDGQLSGNSGIHSRYESGMLGSMAYGNRLAIRPDSTQRIESRADYVFGYLVRNIGLVDSIMHGDSYAKATSGWSSGNPVPAAYYTALWSYTGAMTLDLMQGATLALANLWYSAWIDAGLINPAGVLRDPPVQTADFRLDQNYPNPFNPTTTISYVLPVGGTVRLTVYALDGREVTRFLDGSQSAGRYAVQFDGSALASGVYLYELRLGQFSQVRKLLLLR